MSYNTQPTLGRRIGRSILWILSTALITFVLIVVIGGLIWGAFLGFEEFRRSFSAIAVRNRANEQKIALLRSDVDNLMADSRRVNSLQSEMSDLEARVGGLQETLAADLRRQQEMLATMEEEVTGAIDTGLMAAEDAATLRAAMSALQRDITGNSQRLDELGGELDQLGTEVTMLDNGFAGLQVAVADQIEAEMTETQQAMALFQVWGLIGRARLRLLEANFGLARTDTERALRAMDLLATTVPEAEAEAWQRIERRLELALAGLPADPATAARDLESAWEALDEALAAVLVPQLETVEPLPEETPDSAAGQDATVEPTPAELTPVATPTP